MGQGALGTRRSPGCELQRLLRLVLLLSLVRGVSGEPGTDGECGAPGAPDWSLEAQSRGVEGSWRRSGEVRQAASPRDGGVCSGGGPAPTRASRGGD